MPPRPALPQVTTSVVTKTISIYNAVKHGAASPCERGGMLHNPRQPCTAALSPNDVILRAAIGPAWPAEVLH